MSAFVSQRMVVILVFIQSHTCLRLDSVISFSFNFSLSVQTLKSKLLNWVLNKSWYLDESPNVFSQASALLGRVVKSTKSLNVSRKNLSIAELLELLCRYSGGGRGAVSSLEDLIAMKKMLYGGHQERLLQETTTSLHDPLAVTAGGTEVGKGEKGLTHCGSKI